MARSYVFACAAIALLALCAAPAKAQSSSSTLFPPLCDCVRDNRRSPYRLKESLPVVEGGYVKQCFKVVNVGGCDPNLKCCDGKQGVEKVEFDVALGCKDSLKRVTVDGALKSFEYNTKLSVLRITNLNKTAVTGPGTEICLLLKADSNCTSLSQLCKAGGNNCKYSIFNADRDCCPVSITGQMPPPPFTPAFGRNPPPPPSAFPWCSCQRDAALSKITANLSSISTVPGNLTKACFTVHVKDACAVGSRCCAFDLYKLEIDADPVCSSSLAYSSLDGAKRVRFFQQSPYPVIKVTNINKPFSSVDGTEVCLFLRAPCNTLEKLCTPHNGKCTVALFNKPGTNPSCCPLSYV